MLSIITIHQATLALLSAIDILDLSLPSDRSFDEFSISIGVDCVDIGLSSPSPLCIVMDIAWVVSDGAGGLVSEMGDTVGICEGSYVGFIVGTVEGAIDGLCD